MSNIDKQGRQVQRYANFGVDMMEWADGGYVKHSDYLALLDELDVAEKRIAELERMPSWINHCDKTVPAALRYLAENSRPVGGSSSYNTEHLYDLAREIEITAGTAKGE